MDEDRHEVRKGDCVTLRDGGPRMKVEAVSGDRQTAYCVWVEDGQNKAGTFRAATLVTLPREAWE